MTPTTHEDFWVASGHHLLDRNDGGGLVLTDDFLKAFLARPELAPPDEACPVERGLHAVLLGDPRRQVAEEEIAAIADADARDNFCVFLSFRDRLLAHPTLEAAWMALYSGGVSGVPPLFLQQLTHVIARNAFDAEEDALVLRAAECFFRRQKVSSHDGAVLLADAEVVGRHERDRHDSPLLAMLGGPAATELEVLTAANAAAYRGRSDGHDFVLNVSGGAGRAALGRAASVFIRHMTGLDLAFEPAERLAGDSFGWFVPFDSAATSIGNHVWQGERLEPEAMARVLALYRFTLPEDGRIVAERRGAAGFAIAAVNAANELTVKPQNLIFGLPLAGAGD